MVFEADNFNKTDNIVQTLRGFLEQHTLNMIPESEPPPDNPVTEQLALFFGGDYF